jgi:hypothetical protein
MFFDFLCTQKGMGTDYDKNPCEQYRGELLADGFNFAKEEDGGGKIMIKKGDDIVINLTLPNLINEFRKAERAYGPLGNHWVRLTYRGYVKSRNGGKPYKGFSVQVDPKPWRQVTFADMGGEL